MSLVLFPQSMRDRDRFNDPDLSCPTELRALVIAVEAPGEDVHWCALQRLPEVTAYIADREGMPWDRAALEAAIRAMPTSTRLSRGDLTQRPFYAAMATPLADPLNASACCHAWTTALLGWFVLLWPVARVAGEQNDPRYRMGLGIRKLIASPDWSSLSGPSPLPTPGEWLNQVRQLTVARAGADPRDLQLKLRDCIAMAQAQARERPNHPLSPRGSSPPATGPTTGAGRRPPAVTLRQATVEDLTRGDDEDGDDEPTPTWLFHPATAGLAMTLATDAGVLEMHIEQAECELMSRPTRPAHFTAGELAARLRALEQLPESLDKALARASLLVVGALGIAWEALGECALPLHAPRWRNLDHPPPRAGIALFKRPGTDTWEGIRVLRNPPLPPPPAGTDTTLLYPVAPLAGLPLHPQLTQRIAKALDVLPGTSTQVDAQGLTRMTWDPAVLRVGRYMQVRDQLSALQERHRLEPGRLPQVIHAQLRMQPGVDNALLCLLAADPLSEPATAAFYTCWETTRVATHYLQAQHAIECALDPGLAAEDAPTPPAWPWQPPAMRMGSYRVPTPDAVAVAWRKLAAPMTASPAVRAWALADVLAHHNAWVQCNAFLLSYAFGLRRSVSALHQPVDEDLSAGFLKIRDKGALERTLHFSPLLRRHWQGAGQHLELMRTLMRTRAPEAVSLVEQMMQHWREGHLAGAALQLLASDRRGGVSVLPWTPASLQQALADVGIALPPQLLRHAMRTHSLDQGAPEGVLDALLGHYAWGREAWNSHATWTMARMEQQQGQWIDERLGPLLEVCAGARSHG